MTRQQLQKRVDVLGVQFKPHSDSCLISALGWTAGRFQRWSGWLDRYWITIGKTIWHPGSVDPMSSPSLVAHELVHVRQQMRASLLWWLFRYATSWRFRERMERDAYLVEVNEYGRSIFEVVHLLTAAYGIRTTEGEQAEWFYERKEV